VTLVVLLFAGVLATVLVDFLVAVLVVLVAFAVFVVFCVAIIYFFFLFFVRFITNQINQYIIETILLHLFYLQHLLSFKISSKFSFTLIG